MLYHAPLKLIHLRSNTPDGILALYLNTALRRLGVSLIGIFYPVFIFLRVQDVYGDGVATGFYGVAVYFFFWQFVKLLATFPSAKYLSRFGFRITIATSNVFLILLLIMLMVSENYFWALPIAAVFHGLTTALYWMGFHTLFGNDGIVEKFGEELSILKIFERMGNIAGPALGGLILVIYGFNALFSFALLVVLLSGIPHFFMKRHEPLQNIRVGEVVDWFKQKRHRNEIIGLLGRQIDDKVTAIFLPLFVFLIVGEFSQQGFIEAAALIFGSLSILIAGRYFRKGESPLYFRLGIGLTALTTIVRGIAKNFNQLLIFDSARKIVSPYYWLTFDTLFYDRSRSEESVLTFVVVNQIITAFAMFVVVVFAIAFASSPLRFWSLWALSSLGVLLSSVMWERREK